MRKRTLVPLVIVLALLAALGIALYLRAQAPPEAARLLPESDAIVYLNLKEVRAATHFDDSPITRSPDFQHFIQATGIVPERDLDSAAFALHRMADPSGPNGPVAYSEVFIGRFDGVKLATYLASIASGKESYAGRTIFTIPMENDVPKPRQLRVTQLDYETIAASNMPTAEQIHSMLDRSRASALGTPGSSLLAARFHEVPLLSQAWGIGHIGLPFSQDGHLSFMGLELPLPADTDLVASLRYTAASHVLSGGGVQLRIEEIAPDAVAAQATVDQLSTLLSIMHTVGAAVPPHSPADAATRSILDSIKLLQHKDRATLTANASLEQLKALFASHNPTATPDAATTPKPASK
jgi:hypothetical protein